MAEDSDNDSVFSMDAFMEYCVMCETQIKPQGARARAPRRNSSSSSSLLYCSETCKYKDTASASLGSSMTTYSTSLFSAPADCSSQGSYFGSPGDGGAYTGSLPADHYKLHPQSLQSLQSYHADVAARRSSVYDAPSTPTPLQFHKRAVPARAPETGSLSAAQLQPERPQPRRHSVYVRSGSGMYDHQGTATTHQHNDHHLSASASPRSISLVLPTAQPAPPPTSTQGHRNSMPVPSRTGKMTFPWSLDPSGGGATTSSSVGSGSAGGSRSMLAEAYKSGMKFSATEYLPEVLAAAAAAKQNGRRRREHKGTQ